MLIISFINKVMVNNFRYKVPALNAAGGPGDDPIPDYMNVLSMFCSMFGLMMKVT